MLVELSGKGIPIFSRPFLFASNQRPKILKALEDKSATVTAGEVIQERNGVPFINNSIFKPGNDAEKNLNSEFKELVDTVLGKR